MSNYDASNTNNSKRANRIYKDLDLNFGRNPITNDVNKLGISGCPIANEIKMVRVILQISIHAAPSIGPKKYPFLNIFIILPHGL